MAGGGRPKFTDEQRREMADAYAGGEATSAIAKRFGCSATTVKNACRKFGVTRAEAVAKVQAAADTSRERNALRREQLQEESLTKARTVLARVDQPYLVHAFTSTMEGAEFSQRTLDEPPAQEAKNLATAAHALVRVALDLAKFEAETAGGAESKALIERLADGLQALAGDPEMPSSGEGEA